MNFCPKLRHILHNKQARPRCAKKLFWLKKEKDKENATHIISLRLWEYHPLG
jgi:hypothetical protein